jgi:acyl phosphate:glycerol-3-phosphate acyltransferase
MENWVTLAGFSLLAYLSGSMPFSIWITKWVKKVDVREAGSGHASATNTIRQAGWAAGGAVLALDIAKGFVPTFLAIQYGRGDWVIPIAAMFAVIGHCWPMLAGFRGGMGLATAGGTFIALSPLSFVIALGVLVALVLVIRHAARASVIAGLTVPFIIWLARFDFQTISLAAAVGLVICFSFLRDWQRKYRELWLDRG